MRKKAIGIDLGTTNSVMAVVREDVPEIIPMGTKVQKTLNLTSNVILVVRLPVTHRITHVLILLFFQPWF